MAEKKTESVNLEEVKAVIAKMIADAKSEAQKIVDEAKKQADMKTAEEEAKAAEAAAKAAEMEELVEVKLFKDNGKYKDDVVVGCNGEFIAIQRGERVKIKRKFAEILDNSEHQDYETAKMMEQKSGEFARETARRGL